MACVNSFLRFIKRNSQPHGPSDMRILMEPSRFTPSTILNLDETPIPFEYLDGHTYEICGAKTVSGKSDRSGWGKRQATLMLYIFADGIQRIQPKLIFHGKAGLQATSSEERVTYTVMRLLSLLMTLPIIMRTSSKHGLMRNIVQSSQATTTS